jgi:NAD(P)-dependent dehydrogenase (short-subunit alcohol dehydrogenase family)
MDKKVAIVTGGSCGIGLEISKVLFKEGIVPIIADLKAPKADFVFVKTDVHSEASVKKMVEKIAKDLKGINYLINNAGILPDEKPTSFEEIELETWNQFIGVNLTGPFLCTKYALPYLRKKRGAIVNIASTRAFQSDGTDAPYAASKGGLVALTQAIAINAGPDVRVNSISPGWIHTEKTSLKKKDHEQHPVGRVGEPKDIAYLTAFLLSDEASFITGSNFIADGGMTKKMIYQ